MTTLPLFRQALQIPSGGGGAPEDVHRLSPAAPPRTDCPCRTTAPGCSLFHPDPRTCLAIARRNPRATLASGSVDGTVRLWRVANGRLLRALQGHTNWVRSVAFSPDGATLASGSYDGSVRLWRVADGRLLRTLQGHTDWVRSVAFSPDGATLASGSDDKTVRLWRVSDGALLQTLQGHTDRVYSVAFSPDGATLASGSLDGTVRLWRVAP